MELINLAATVPFDDRLNHHAGLDDLKLSLIAEHGEAELVITGRDPDPALLERADYVTEMNLIKHPYEKGVLARKGIEY